MAKIAATHLLPVYGLYDQTDALEVGATIPLSESDRVYSRIEETYCVGYGIEPSRAGWRRFLATNPDVGDYLTFHYVDKDDRECACAVLVFV